MKYPLRILFFATGILLAVGAFARCDNYNLKLINVAGEAMRMFLSTHDNNR